MQSRFFRVICRSTLSRGSFCPRHPDEVIALPLDHDRLRRNARGRLGGRWWRLHNYHFWRWGFVDWAGIVIGIPASIADENAPARESVLACAAAGRRTE